MSKNTKKIGRTLTTIADSQNKGARDRMSMFVSKKARSGRRRKGKANHMRSADNESLGLDIGESEITFLKLPMHPCLKDLGFNFNMIQGIRKAIESEVKFMLSRVLHIP